MGDNSNQKNSIVELIAITKSIAEYKAEEIDDNLLELLEKRNSLFQQIDENMQKPEFVQEHREILEQLLTVHRQATEIIEQYKELLADSIRKIGKGKQTANLYEHGKKGSSDAAFFDTKK